MLIFLVVFFAHTGKPRAAVYGTLCHARRREISIDGCGCFGGDQHLPSYFALFRLVLSGRKPCFFCAWKGEGLAFTTDCDPGQLCRGLLLSGVCLSSLWNSRPFQHDHRLYPACFHSGHSRLECAFHGALPPCFFFPVFGSCSGADAVGIWSWGTFHDHKRVCPITGLGLGVGCPCIWSFWYGVCGGDWCGCSFDRVQQAQSAISQD